MKVKELVAELQTMDPEGSVYVNDTRFGTIGGSPKVLLRRCQAGFDWDHGKVILYPEKNMTSVSPEAVKDMVTYANQVGLRQKFEREIADLKNKLNGGV